MTIAASAVTPEGKELGWASQTTEAPISSGKFLATFKMGAKPGKCTLRTAVYATNTKKGSALSLPIEVPDFAQVETAADGSTRPVLSGTVVIVREMQPVAENAPEDPADPFAAFRLTSVRVIPLMPSDLHKTDSVSFFFQVYDLQVDPATKKARGTARVRLVKEGKGQITSSEETAIDTPMVGTEIGPVALSSLDPGKYVARLEATDKIAQKTITREAAFEIRP